MRTFTVIAISLCCTSALAEEPLNWRIVGPETPIAEEGSSQLWTIVGQCHCLGLGDCLCGPECRCRQPPASKPAVFAYKDFGSVCPGCIRLEQQADSLPVRLQWRQAPGWVRSFPTLHWRGDDGRWYQYAWGGRDDDVVAFQRVWEATLETVARTTARSPKTILPSKSGTD